jgi:arginyl-tRNA synthetase
MNVYAHFEQQLASAIAALHAAGALPVGAEGLRLGMEPTRDATHGDLATNAAMMLAKPTGMKPRDLAELIAEPLRAAEGVEKVEIAGPGFINLTLSPSFWPRVVSAVLAGREAYGRSDLGKGHKVNVEYVSANPTGPLHVGHCRGAVVGDALAGLLAFAGFDVTKEYYINDAGAQVNVLARSAYLRYREALGEAIGTIPEGLYPGEYLKPVGAALAAEHGTKLHNLPEEEWLPLVRQAAIAAMLDLIRDDLALLQVKQDVFFSERSLTAGPTDRVAATIAWLRARDLVYEGRLPPPKGEKLEDWEDREQTLFRATNYGDDVDRPLVKSNDQYTYFAADIAYHRNKYLRGFKHLIDIWGADHAGHIKRMVSAVKALSEGKADLDVKICQLVKLFKNGEPFKMSKRSGNFVTLRDVVEEVGSDPVRFMMLYRKNDAPLDFDFAKVTEKSRDNPVFYVQYAHARANSVFRMAQEAFPGLAQDVARLAGADVSGLTDEGELALIKRIGQFPRMIEQAAQAHEPHRVAFYLYDLASDFHGLWNRGKDLPHLRFIREDDEKQTAARLALVGATIRVLHSGLSILGVHAPEEMR